MRLIKIAAATSDIGPIDRLSRTNKPQHLLETSNAAKQFWRQPDFAPELFDELLVADPEVMRNRRDALQMRLAHKLADGPGHSSVPARAFAAPAERRCRSICSKTSNLACGLGAASSRSR